MIYMLIIAKNQLNSYKELSDFVIKRLNRLAEFCPLPGEGLRKPALRAERKARIPERLFSTAGQGKRRNTRHAWRIIFHR